MGVSKLVKSIFLLVSKLTEKEDSNKTKESNQPEKAKEAEPSNDKLKTLNMRMHPSTIIALKKICPDGQMTATVTELIEHAIKQSGGKIQNDGSYEKLVSDAESYRRKLDGLEKAMNHTFARMHNIAQKELLLTIENADQIIVGFLKYPLNPEKDNFTERDRNDYVQWLECWVKNKNAEQALSQARTEKYGVTVLDSSKQPKREEAKTERYISEKDRCGCSARPKHTLFEHNQRAFHIQDGMHHGINQFCDTPQEQLERINRFGSDHATSKEEKDMIVKYLKEHGSNNQKEMVNIYFYNHGFPPPFPEIEKVEDQKPIILWKPEGRKDD
jgi:hypothetical protein